MRLKRKAKPQNREPVQGKRNGRSPSPRLPRWVREGIGIALIGGALFLFLSVFSYSPETDPGFFHQISPKPRDVRNLGGPVGSYAASFLKETLGLGAYFVSALVAVLALFVIAGRRLRMALWKLPLGLIFLFSLSTLFSLALPPPPAPEQGQGGFIGFYLATNLQKSLHPAGSYLVVILLLVLSCIFLGEVALLRQINRLLTLFLRAAVAALEASCRTLRSAGQGVRGAGNTMAPRIRRLWEDLRGRIRRMRVPRQKTHAPPASPGAWEENSHALAIGDSPHGQKKAPKLLAAPPAAASEAPGPAAETETATETDGLHSRTPIKITPLQRDPHAPEEAEPAAQKDKPAKKPRQIPLPFPHPLPKGYRPPPLELLDNPDPAGSGALDRQQLLDSAKVLEQKLRDFGIDGRVTEIHPGPIITLFEYEPAPGIKVNRIVNLSDDLALAMKAISVRIVAPIPGKAVVGIEVPNPQRQVVRLKDVLASDAFQKSGHKLPLALGKDIAGKPFATDLSRMPHLLIAGATGTGKSVCLHSLILSLLFRFSPQEVKFLIIDPKLLELSAYHGIPHLMHPVITDARRAQDVLDWAVERMEQRYQLLSEKGVRNVDGYNERIEKELAASGKSAEELAEEEEREAAEGEGLDTGMLPEKGKLPYIILVIDEMADLMIVSGRQIEESITRLAQMARAAGIHLLLATQRPSVDVLTGIIKANLPTRISFQVSSRIDSRTILDSIGAEKLLGLGDMLFLPPGTSKIRRIHGAYVTEPEIERVVEYLKQFGKPRYEKIPFRAKKGAKERDDDEPFEEDEKYDEAVRLVTDTRQASISMIQRKLRVGYNRAARMIERMEQQGIVGPQEGVKPREVLANSLE